MIPSPEGQVNISGPNIFYLTNFPLGTQRPRSLRYAVGVRAHTHTHVEICCAFMEGLLLLSLLNSRTAHTETMLEDMLCDQDERKC